MVRIVDLRAIRAGLKELDLDWGLPAYRPSEPDDAKPLRLQIDKGTFYWSNAEKQSHIVAIQTLSLAFLPLDAAAYARRAQAYLDLGRWQEALADLDCWLAFCVRKTEWNQPMALACNNRAWELVREAKAQPDPNLAVLLAVKAVQLDPDNGFNHNTLGVAYYRLGQWQKARASLERSLELQRGGFLAFDLYFMAMSHQRLGQTKKARECYEQAGKWWAGQSGLTAGHVQELTAFRNEAAAVLGLPAPTKQ